MTDHFRYIWQLFVLTAILILTGILFLPGLETDLPLKHYLITIVSLCGINLLAWIILARGAGKASRNGAVIMLVGISGKFLLYLLYVLVFWMVTKIITKPFIVTFFALYLLFTFLLAANLLKLLKNK